MEKKIWSRFVRTLSCSKAGGAAFSPQLPSTCHVSGATLGIKQAQRQASWALASNGEDGSKQVIKNKIKPLKWANGYNGDEKVLRKPLA